MSATSIDIEFVNGYVLLGAMLNERFNGRMLLDTGADVSVVTPRTAERLGLEIVGTHESRVAGGGSVTVRLSRIETMSIGEQTASLDPVAVLDLGVGASQYGVVDGIVGSDFLRRIPFTIDYQRHVLTIEDPDSLSARREAGTILPLNLVRGTSPFLPVNVNGIDLGEYKLDTGAATTHLPLSDLNRLGVGKEGLVEAHEESVGPGGSYETVIAHLDSFSLGGGPDVSDLRVKAYETAYGFIGNDYLSAFVLTVNYAERYVVLAGVWDSS